MKKKSKDPPKNRVRIKFGDVEVETEGDDARKNADEVFSKLTAEYKEHWQKREGALRDYR